MMRTMAPLKLEIQSMYWQNNMLKYNTKLKRKSPPNDTFTVGQGYVQGGVDFYFVTPDDHSNSKMLREDVILDLFEIIP